MKLGAILSKYEVVQFVHSIHYNKQDFEEGNIRENIEEYDNYQVREVSMDLVEDPQYYVDEEVIEENMEKEISTMPPIVLGFYDDGEFQTIDGGHRVTIAKIKAAGSVKALVAIKG